MKRRGEDTFENIFSTVIQSPSGVRAAFSSCSLSEAVPGCRLGRSLSTSGTCNMSKEFHLLWFKFAHQTFFCTRKTRSALAIESFSLSRWSCVNLVASLAPCPPVKLPSMLVCNGKLTQSQSSNHLLGFDVVVLLAEKADDLVEFDQLLQSQLFILPAWAQREELN